MCRATANESALTDGSITKDHITKPASSSAVNGAIAKGHIAEPASSSSAIRRMTPLILSGYAFNTICYFLVRALLPADLSPAARYCPGDDPNCARRDLFAFQVVSLINLSFLGLLGFHTFYVSKRATTALPRTPQGRYLGNVLRGGRVLLPEADYVNAVSVIFQGWDFVASFFFEEHCTMIMMTHHMMAFLCGVFCLWYEVNPYYSVYVGGVCEFSGIFLSISELFQYYPPASLVSSSSTLSSILPAVEAFCQAMFVMSFMIFRVVGWAYTCCMFYSDGSYVFKHGLLQRYSPGSGWFLCYLLSISFCLGILQLYWANGIVNKVLEILNEQ